jgi:hypothetical protein
VFRDFCQQTQNFLATILTTAPPSKPEQLELDIDSPVTDNNTQITDIVDNFFATPNNTDNQNIQSNYLSAIGALVENGALTKELVEDLHFQKALSSFLEQLLEKAENITPFDNISATVRYECFRLFTRNETHTELSAIDKKIDQFNNSSHGTAYTVATAAALGILCKGDIGAMLGFSFGGIVATLLYPFKLLDKDNEIKNKFGLSFVGPFLLSLTISTVVTQGVKADDFPDLKTIFDDIKLIPAEFLLGSGAFAGLQSFWDSGIASRGAIEEMFYSNITPSKDLSGLIGQLHIDQHHTIVADLQTVLLDKMKKDRFIRLDAIFDQIEAYAQENELDSHIVPNAYLDAIDILENSDHDADTSNISLKDKSQFIINSATDGLKKFMSNKRKVKRPPGK